MAHCVTRDDLGGGMIMRVEFYPAAGVDADRRRQFRFMRTPTEVLEQFYAAVNRNDIEAVVTDFDLQIVRVEPGGIPTAGTYRGIAEVQAHVAHGRGTWAEGTCEPERYLVHGDTVVVYVHVRVRLHGSTDWLDARFADGFIVRNRKIAEFRTFAERADALAWAGIDDQPGNQKAFPTNV